MEMVAAFEWKVLVESFFFLNFFFCWHENALVDDDCQDEVSGFQDGRFFTSPLFFLKFEKYLSRGSSGAVNANALVKHSEKYLAAGVKNDSPN